MKKVNVLAAVFCMAAGSLSAQNGFYLGVEGVPQFSFLLNADDADNNTIDPETTFSGAFGIAGGYGFNDNIGLELGVLYSMEGEKKTIADVEVFERVDFIKIPLLFTYNTDPSKSVMFRAKVGPQLSLLTNASVKDWDSNDLVEDNKDVYNNAVFGAALNIGASFKLTDQLFFDAGIKGDIGFTNLEDEDHTAYVSGRASTLPLTTGLEIGLRYFLN